MNCPYQKKKKKEKKDAVGDVSSGYLRVEGCVTLATLLLPSPIACYNTNIQHGQNLHFSPD